MFLNPLKFRISKSQINFKRSASMFQCAMTDAHLLEQFLRNPNFSPSTRKSYSIILRTFARFFPEKLLREITGNDVLKFLLSKPEASRDTYLWVIKSFLRFINNGELREKFDVCKLNRSVRNFDHKTS